jgi:transposase, IS5 family
MRGQPGFCDIEERLRELSAKGDELERLNSVVDFELFRRDLERAVPRSDRSKGGRPAFDHMLMFKVLIVQASHSLSDERTEYLIKDRGRSHIAGIIALKVTPRDGIATVC